MKLKLFFLSTSIYMYMPAGNQKEIKKSDTLPSIFKIAISLCINDMPALNIKTIIILERSKHINIRFFISLSRNILSHQCILSTCALCK